MTDKTKINDLYLTPLKKIDTPGGDVLRALKKSEKNFSGFGEAYFSVIKYGAKKGWKKHKKMISNIIVPFGEVRFVLFDDRQGSTSYGNFVDVTLSPANYKRLCIPPLLWMAFQGVGKTDSILLNVANIEHQPDESESKSLGEINYNW